MKKNMKSRLIKAGVSVFVLGMVVLPFLSSARSGDKIYVDRDASGTEDGSSSHPYKTIWQGVDKAKSGDEVVVSSGIYKERITLPVGVKLSGAGKGKTILKSNDQHDDPVVNMKDRTKLWGVTVENGKIGIYVREGARVDIIESEIRDNRHEGIMIESGDRNDSEKASIVNSDIVNNGWSGIYSKKRKVVIIDSTIRNNDKNGIVFESGVRAWVENNSISKNAGSGLVANLDNADITIAKKNSFRENGRDGIEVNSYGATGTFDVKKSRFANNARYGIARLSKVSNISASVWNGLVVEGSTVFLANSKGNTSPIIRGF